MALITERANPMFPEYAWAEFSEDRKYRYRLHRQLEGNGKGKIVWCMLNPSTADAFKLDPTLRRCKSFSEAWGYKEMMIVNLFAFRSPNPKDLVTAKNPVGDHNHEILQLETLDSDMIICGWGADPMVKKLDVYAMANAIGARKKKVYCLGHNTDGSPKHPLYVPKTAHLTAHDL